MSDPLNGIDHEITFTIGKGNQSAICGGVVPMDVVDPKIKPKTQQTEPKAPTDAETRNR
jgi:hypothetical protein